MNNSEYVYGASAFVFIQFDGDLKELGRKISGILNIPLRFENREVEPYELLGYSEVLGFEIQISPSYNNFESDFEFQFLLEMFTEDSFKEIYNKQMFDISHWMARY